MTPKIANKNASAYVSRREAFVGSNLVGVRVTRENWIGIEKGQVFYIVYSYAWYPIFIYDSTINQWFETANSYSRTTAKHISQARPAATTKVIPENDMRELEVARGWVRYIAKRFTE